MIFDADSNFYFLLLFFLRYKNLFINADLFLDGTRIQTINTKNIQKRAVSVNQKTNFFRP